MSTWTQKKVHYMSTPHKETLRDEVANISKYSRGAWRPGVMHIGSPGSKTFTWAGIHTSDKAILQVVELGQVGRCQHTMTGSAQLFMHSQEDTRFGNASGIQEAFFQAGAVATGQKVCYSEELLASRSWLWIALQSQRWYTSALVWFLCTSTSQRSLSR